MKIDNDGKGYFEEGKYHPVFEVKTKTIEDEVKENLDFNIFLLPSILQIDDVCDMNLYSIYKEAYCCIACGLYDAGIIKMGQLLEITLKQIIFIKSNDLSKRKMFGQALGIAWKKGIIEYVDYHFLFWFLNEFRNPYTHRNFKDILKDAKIPIRKIPTQFKGKEFNPEDLVKILGSVIKGLSNGKYEYEWIDATTDPGIACQAKESQDKITSIILLWFVTIHFEQLVKIYLNEKCYAEHNLKYGSPYDKLTSLEIEEEM